MLGTQGAEMLTGKITKISMERAVPELSYLSLRIQEGGELWLLWINVAFFFFCI